LAFFVPGLESFGKGKGGYFEWKPEKSKLIEVKYRENG
jgi:hypothetical protein